MMHPFEWKALQPPKRSNVMETIRQKRAGQGRARGGQMGGWAGFIHQGLHIEGSAPGKKGGRADCAGD